MIPHCLETNRSNVLLNPKPCTVYIINVYIHIYLQTKTQQFVR